MTPELKRLKIFTLFAVVMLVSVSAGAEELHLRWLKKPVMYSLKEKPLRDLLKEFCITQGAAFRISDKVTGKVSGNFSFSDPAQFLGILARHKGITWYYDGSMVWFYTLEEKESEIIRLDNVKPEALKKNLEKMGVYDPRFKWKTVEDDGILYVCAPPRYLELIQNVAGQVQVFEGDVKIMQEFPLKYASATDQTIKAQDSTLVIPGVATLLRRMIFGDDQEQPEQAAARKASDKPVRKNKGLMGTGVVGRIQDPVSAEPKAGANILADPRRNAVLIWDSRDRMKQYAELIERLDRPTRLVEIKAAIVDVEVNSLDELGFQYSVDRNSYDPRQDGVGLVGGANIGSGNLAVNFRSPNGSGLNFSTIYIHGIETLMGRVHALETNGDADVLSRPTVLTVDNREAVLQHTETFYVKLEGEDAVDLVDITSGTVLQVTPHVIFDEKNPKGKHKIKLNVFIEDGSDNNAQTAQVDNLPRIRKSTITTCAVVKEGHALVIGGHYSETKRETESGIPLLMNIPLLGHLFKSKQWERRKMERLFILTPRVMSFDSPEPDIAPKGTLFKKTLKDKRILKGEFPAWVTSPKKK